MDNEIAIDETSKMTSKIQQSKTGLGEILKNAREAMHLTQKEAASRLYLNPKIIEIIEHEAFFEGPPMTFMRGYIRSYAKLLNVPESDVKATIDGLELVVSASTPTAPALQTNPIYRGDRYIRWITYLIILTLISLVVLWWTSHSKNNTTEATSAMTQTSTTTETAPTATESVTPPAPGAQVDTTPNTTSTQTIAEEPVATPSTTTVNAAAPTSSNIPASTATVGTTTNVATPIQDTTQQTTPLSDNATTPPDNTNGLIPATTPMNASATAVTEDKPMRKSKKKYRRHQYRPIENMEIPEPE